MRSGGLGRGRLVSGLAAQGERFAFSPSVMERIRGFHQKNGVFVCVSIKHPACSKQHIKCGSNRRREHFEGLSGRAHVKGATGVYGDVETVEYILSRKTVGHGVGICDERMKGIKDASRDLI